MVFEVFFRCILWEQKMADFRFIARALRHRNYRLFFGGQGVSLVGTWMQQVALAWLVYRLTNSALLLGLVGFAGQLPTFLLTSFGGVLADRWNRLHLLIVIQTLAAIQASILALLTLTGQIAIWHIFLLGIGMGVITAFDVPTRQSLIGDMLDKREDLGNAIALNSLMFNGARLVGPSIAGLLLSVTSEGVCFLMNAISFVAVIGALAAMRIPRPAREPAQQRILQGLKEGYTYGLGFAPIRYILTNLALLSLMGLPYTVLMPIFAKDILGGGPHTLGFLVAVSGVGALLSALYLASRKSVIGLGTIIGASSGIFGCALVFFSFSRYVPLSLLMSLCTGFGLMGVITSTNTILQTISQEDKRGRVMSLYAMAFMGMTPFGSLIIGALANRIGAPHAVFVGGIVCIISSFLFFRRLPTIRKLIRPIYVEKGILTESPVKEH
jgi:MFS family permease